MLAVVHGVTDHGTITTNQVNRLIGTLVRAGMNQTPTTHGNRITRGGINNPTTGKPKTNAIAGTEGFERETNSHVQNTFRVGPPVQTENGRHCCLEYLCCGNVYFHAR